MIVNRYVSCLCWPQYFFEYPFYIWGSHNCISQSPLQLGFRHVIHSNVSIQVIRWIKSIKMRWLKASLKDNESFIFPWSRLILIWEYGLNWDPYKLKDWFGARSKGNCILSLSEVGPADERIYMGTNVALYVSLYNNYCFIGSKGSTRIVYIIILKITQVCGRYFMSVLIWQDILTYVNTNVYWGIYQHL